MSDAGAMAPRVGATPAPGAAGADGQPARQPDNPLVGLARMFIIWWLFRQVWPQTKTSNLTRDQVFMPRMPKGTPLDVYIYLSETTKVDVNDATALIWSEKEISLAGLKGQPTHEFIYRPSKRVQNNGTLYVHAYFVETGFSLDPDSPFFDSSKMFRKTELVNRYLPRPKRREGVNLLSGAEPEQHALAPEAPQEGEEETGPQEIISFFRPNITFAMVDDFATYPINTIPPHLAPVLTLHPESMTYDPTIWLDDFWLLREHLIPMNQTVEELPLHFSLYTLPLWKLNLYLQMLTAFNMQIDWGMMRDGESDEFKRVLLEGNPYFLGLTMFVSLLHSLFDVLAFKNDIGFWRNKQSVEGLSVRTIVFNCACQLIILLYLLDNETSLVVLFSSFLGLVIEFWKVTQAMNVTIDRSGPFPKLKFADKESYSESNTNQYDKEAMRYLTMALLPCVGGYAIYALMYETHKSWYSWLLGSLVGAVYTFGFILMCPQLYLNYKLKSVAHLPWRQMTYKFLNTIIDDLFAFVIKMPTLHRLSVFRDDIIFLIYLYQRWAYRVDMKRANEFGYVELPPAAGEGEEVARLTEGEPLALEGSSPADSISSFEDLAKEVPQERDNLRQRKGAADVSGQAGPSSEAGPSSADDGSNPRKRK